MRMQAVRKWKPVSDEKILYLDFIIGFECECGEELRTASAEDDIVCPKCKRVFWMEGFRLFMSVE